MCPGARGQEQNQWQRLIAVLWYEACSISLRSRRPVARPSPRRNLQRLFHLPQTIRAPSKLRIPQRKTTVSDRTIISEGIACRIRPSKCATGTGAAVAGGGVIVGGGGITAVVGGGVVVGGGGVTVAAGGSAAVATDGKARRVSVSPGLRIWSAAKSFRGF